MREVGTNGLQDKIVKSIRAQGGGALKTNGSFIKGTLDLILFLPGYALTLVEVKHIKLSSSDFKHRAIETSALQRETLRRFRDYSVQLIGVEVGRLVFLYIADPLETVLLPDMPNVPYVRGKGFDLKRLWLKLPEYRLTKAELLRGKPTAILSTDTATT